MTVLTKASPTSLELAIAAFQARPILFSVNEIKVRRRLIGFGWELARIQGAEKTPGWMRLLDLFANGQITDAEYEELGLKLALRGDLTAGSGVAVRSDGG